MKKINELNITQIQNALEVGSAFLTSYNEKYSWKIKLIDSFIVFNVILFVLQLVYAFLIGLYPLNAILSGLMCSMGSITLSGKK
jgi:hypothetical protein